jgi:hypothetical protein
MHKHANTAEEDYPFTAFIAEELAEIAMDSEADEDEEAG